MDFKEIRKQAKNMGINLFQKNKMEIIRSIQREENNIDCYGRPRVEFCQEQACLWRNDCLSLNEKMRGK